MILTSQFAPVHVHCPCVYWFDGDIAMGIRLGSRGWALGRAPTPGDGGVPFKIHHSKAFKRQSITRRPPTWDKSCIRPWVYDLDIVIVNGLLIVLFVTDTTRQY